VKHNDDVKLVAIPDEERAILKHTDADRLFEVLDTTEPVGQCTDKTQT